MGLRWRDMGRFTLLVPVCLTAVVLALQLARGRSEPPATGAQGLGPTMAAPVTVDARRLPPDGDHPATTLRRRHPAGEAELDEAKTALDDAAPAPPTQSSPMPRAAVSSGFDGINSAQSSCGGCYPPDGAIAAGPNYIVAAVNTAFEIWDKTGGPFSGYPKALASLLVNPDCLPNISDPFAEYDVANDRFMLGALTYDASYNSSVCVAVSQTGDPAATWYVYGFSITPAQDLLDFPHATIGATAIYVTGNQFQNGTTFAGARAYAYDKTQMYAGQSAASVFVDVGNNNAGKLADTVMPARGLGGIATEYFVAADNSLCPCSDVSVWKWTDPFGASAFALMGGVSVSSYGQPPNAAQLGGHGLPGLIATNDAGDLAAYWSGGTLYGAHTVAVNPGAGTVAGVGWYQIGNLDAAPVLLQQGTVAGNGQYRYYPNLSVDVAGNMMLAYAESSSTEYAGIRYAAHLVGDAAGALQSEVVLKAGEGTVSPSGRYGDYAGAAIDPDGCSLWHFAEYARAGSAWGTWASSVRFTGCSTVPSVGGIAEQPDLTALPAPSTRRGEHMVVFMLSGAFVVMALVAAVYMWAARARR
jgi:hypothetical protein